MNSQEVNKESLNIVQEKIFKLRQIVPECFSEGILDIEKLQRMIGSTVDSDNEKYTLNWSGRNKTFETINITAKSTLVPDKTESVNFDETKNVFIEGENLEVLKLLQKSYFGKIKMIYIDPPYNTGKDFIYKDNFHNGINTYLEQTEQSKNGIRLTTNPETSGRFHADWISFMYARLYMARNLLSDDALIFVSIDDHEVHNLKFVMNDIFGEENLISEVVWHSKYTTSNDKKFISTQHEYVLVYAKNISKANFNLLPRTEKADSGYKNPDNDPRGRWKPTPLHAKSGRNNMEYRFTNIRKFNGEKIPPFIWSAPKGRYPRYNKTTLQRLEADNRITCGTDGTGVPNAKTFLNEVKNGIIAGSLWKYEDVGHTHEANEELSELIDKGIFDNPKPVKLIKRTLQLSTNMKDNDIILDFFAGSGTTAHAVLELNKEDGGNRKFIVVQIPEAKTQENIKKYATIADICKERIRCVIKKLNKERNLGFKVFKLAKSNYKIWNDYNELDKKKFKEQLKLFEQPLIARYKDIDVIYECIIKDGLDLNSNIDKINTKPNTVYKVTDSDRSFYICLDKTIHSTAIKLAKITKDDTFICIDAALNDSQKTNMTRQCRLKTL